MPKATLALSLTTLIALAAAPSFAASNCAPRDAVATALAMNHGEAPVSGGIQGNSRILEVFVSEETDTWSILVTNANGMACIVASGTDWSRQSVLPAGIPG